MRGRRVLQDLDTRGNDLAMMEPKGPGARLPPSRSMGGDYPSLQVGNVYECLYRQAASAEPSSIATRISEKLESIGEAYEKAESLSL